MKYLGKEISEYSLETLQAFKALMDEALAKREIASKHEKFNTDVVRNNIKIPKMEFPPINPEFLKIKTEIEQAIESKKNV